MSKSVRRTLKANNPQVEARFETEESRTHHYLLPQTAAPLRIILQDNLLTAHLSTVINMPNSGLDAMIDLDKLDDLARLYRLFATVKSGLPLIKKTLKESIARRGKEINSAQSGSDSQDAPSTNKPKGPTSAAQVLTLALKWVQDVLDLKDKFDTVWKQAFQSDREIETALIEVRLVTTPIS